MHLPNSRLHAAVWLTVAALCACSELAAAGSGDGDTGTPPDIAFQRQLLSFFQGGGSLQDVHPSSLLHPLSSAPMLSTTAYLFLADDPSTIRLFYAKLSAYAMNAFTPERLTGEGLVPGSGPAGQIDDPYLSPAFNALANLELHCLHLMAARIGAYEDAIEFLLWSRMFSNTTSAFFYNPAKDAFFATDRGLVYLERYAPSNLLPLLIDRNLGSRSRLRIIRKSYEAGKVLERNTGAVAHRGSIWDDERLRPYIADLLATIPEMPPEYAELLYDQSAPAAGRSRSDRETDLWRTLWTVHRPAGGGKLFPAWTVISALTQFSRIIDREGLQEPEKAASLRADVDTLSSRLERDTFDLETYVETIGVTNSLLARFSQMTAVIGEPSKRFMHFNDGKWNRISPRTRRLLKDACFEARDELLRAKTVLSGALARGTGITAKILLSERPLRIGRPIEFKARLESSLEPLDISRLYIQIGENRIRITADGDDIHLAPGDPPYIYTGVISLPPTQEPGIVSMPVFFDFLSGGTRVEIHARENVTLMYGYDAALRFPEGRRIHRTPLPVHVVLRYRPDHDIQGIVRGTFLKDTKTSPDLPARFLVRSGSDITTLPLEISTDPAIPPGRYPFSISLELDGKQIAAFDEELIRPFRWFCLGPMPFEPGLLTTAVEHQNDIFRAYRSSDGRTQRWREVPAGALGAGGEILPDRLIAGAGGGSLILYTVLEVPSDFRVRWKLESRGMSSVWINGEPILTESAINDRLLSGDIKLRKGINSVCIASCWESTPAPVLFELSDMSGLPVPGINNEVDRIIEGFEQLARAGNRGGDGVDSSERLREVELSFTYPAAAEISVIGSFNNWNPDSSPMARSVGGVWTATLILPPGQYTYKYLIDRKVKTPNPGSPLTEPDGFGGTNSILVVE